jgi:hypothetical protein
MSVDEVLETLHKVGEFRVNKGEWSGGYIQLAVSFTDPNDRELYGSFDLGFFDSKYESAYIRGFDFLANICDFSQLPQSATATPNP